MDKTRITTIKSRNNLLVGALFIFAIMGGLIKIMGSILYGSKSLFVDALTSFANIIALIFTIYYAGKSSLPPDTDHPYGHIRLGIGGYIYSMTAYGFVAGISLMEILYSAKYSVKYGAVIYALLGFIVYLIVVVLARMIGGFYKSYGAFTISELIESIVVVFATYGGATYSYLIDYGGAVSLTAYIFYEIYATSRETLDITSDRSPPREILKNIYDVFTREGFRIIGIRIRSIIPGIYHGDITVTTDGHVDCVNAWKKIYRIKRILREKRAVDLVVEYVPPIRSTKGSLI